MFGEVALESSYIEHLCCGFSQQDHLIEAVSRPPSHPLKVKCLSAEKCRKQCTCLNFDVRFFFGRGGGWCYSSDLDDLPKAWGSLWLLAAS